MARHRFPLVVFLLWGILAAGGCSSEPAAPTPTVPPPQEKQVEVGATPWGTITKVEAADSWQGQDVKKQLPPPGQRFWILRITEATPIGPQVNSRSDWKKSSLVDASGEKHSPLWVEFSSNLLVKPGQTPGRSLLVPEYVLMVYSMPRDRTPKELELGDGARVPLPDR